MAKKHQTFLGARLFCLCLLLSWLTPAQATVVYTISIDTTEISGTVGHLDFFFGASFNSPDASAGISGFTSNGMVTGSPSTFGTVTGGPLPNPFTLFTVSNAPADYFHDFTFGTTLSFILSLNFQSPNPSSFTTDDTISLSLYTGPCGDFPSPCTPLLNKDTDAADAIVYIDFHPNGSTTVHDNSTKGQLTVTSGVPEPATLPLTACALIAMAWYLLKCPRV